MLRFLRTLLILTMLLVFLAPAAAQENLLQNPGFEGNYVPFGRGDFTFAPSWSGWFTNSPKTEVWMNENPIAYPHTASTKRSGDRSQNIGRGDATFTSATYQVVPNVPEGTTLRFTVWVFQERKGAQGAQTRVGIGAGAQNNPLGAITWSDWMRSLDSWQQVTVEATVPAGPVTVFIYSTQTAPAAANQVYYDDASLVVTGSGTPDAPTAGGTPGTPAVPAPPTSTPFVSAPFVSAQGEQEDGSIRHTVQSGDTLAAIAVAYGVPVSRIRELNGVEGSILQVGQELLIREAPTPAPATEAPTEEPAEDSDASGEGTDSETSVEPAAPTDAPVIAQVPTSTEAPAEVEPTDEPVEEPTDGPAVEPTEEPADEPTATLDVSPTPSEPPSTPTPAPPAPVTPGADGDPVTTEGSICVLMFEDNDQNRIRSGEEAALADGQIILRDESGAEVDQLTTAASADPTCFEGLTPGNYRAEATAPAGFGLTTPAVLAINLPVGARFNLSFGAAEGLAVAVAPTPDGDSLVVDPVTTEPEAPVDLSSFAGLIVIGLAGLVLVGGAVVALIARRL